VSTLVGPAARPYLVGVALVAFGCGPGRILFPNIRTDAGASGDAASVPATGVPADARESGDDDDGHPLTDGDGDVRPVVFGPGSAVVSPDSIYALWAGEQCGQVPVFQATDTVYASAGQFEIDGDSQCSLTAAYGGGGMPVGTEIVFPDEPLTVTTSTVSSSGETIPLAYGVQSSLQYPNGAWLTVRWDQGVDARPLIVGVPKVTFISLPTHAEDVVRVRFRVDLTDGRYLDLQIAPNLPAPVYQPCPAG
jgi:hypothetical protein